MLAVRLMLYPGLALAGADISIVTSPEASTSRAAEFRSTVCPVPSSVNPPAVDVIVTPAVPLFIATPLAP